VPLVERRRYESVHGLVKMLAMTTTNKQAARAKFARANAERAAQQRKNVDDLTQFVVEVGRADEVDGWLEDRIDKARREAELRRRRHEVAAGRALAAVRSRGEAVESIAGQLGISQAKVREYVRLAETGTAGSNGQAEQQ
jgi:uncharacterized protein YdaU (DUF1376 family)